MIHPPHGEHALLALVLVALGALIVGCVCAWLRPSNHPHSIYFERKGRRE